MRLSCLKGIPFLLAVVACSDSTGPPSRTSVTYLLESINGQRLPVIIGSIPEEGIIVLEGTVFLREGATAPAGNASISEGRLEFSRGVVTRRNYFHELRYTVLGNSLELRSREACPPQTNCVELSAVIAEPLLNLEFGQLTYSYRRQLPPAL